MLSRPQIYETDPIGRDGNPSAPGGAPEEDPLGVVGQVAGFISHDLRLPLTSILAYTELLATNDLNEAQRMDLLQEVRSNVLRMTDMISSLVELSRGRNSLKRETADITESVRRAIRMVALEKSNFSSALITYEHHGLAVGWFDAKRFERIVTNLVGNACDAVSLEGKVGVTSFGNADHVEICVWDNGPGIPGPIRDSLFTPHVSYGKDDGTGLGLAIVQKLTKDHGGELFLDESCEGGTLFRITLPYLLPGSPRIDKLLQASRGPVA